MIISKKFINAKIGDFSEDIKQKIKIGIKNKKGVYIFGPCGTGKTHLAYAFYIHSVENFKGSTRFRNFSELLYTIKSSITQNKSNFLDQMLINDDFPSDEEKKILILDDIGSEKTTDWVIETLGLIINRYYEMENYIFITSNLNLEELQQRYGDRIASRIAEMCEIIKLEGEDRRTK
jgi:DNA replication protein DnaC